LIQTKANLFVALCKSTKNYFEEERKMRKIIVFALIVFGMAAANSASADTVRGINIDFVAIGNAGNTGAYNGCGAVGYNYRIGKYEVTNAQWNTFTTAAGAPTGNDGGYIRSAYFTGAQQPTNYISWYETLQFCNYLTSGDKSKGAYQFSGNNADPGNFIGIDRAAAQATYGIIYVLPTDDEWYKAACYKPDGSGYSLYANGTNTTPIAGVQSNYNWAIGAPWDVGTGTQEQNGTFDMMGNVWEWNETLFSGSLSRSLRGGSYGNSGCGIESTGRLYYGPAFEGDFSFGFRVASVPEPATLCLLGLGGLGLLRRKYRAE
jgi:hypothetical protein